MEDLQVTPQVSNYELENKSWTDSEWTGITGIVPAEYVIGERYVSGREGI